MSDTSSSRNPLRQVAASLRDLRARHQERHRPTNFGFAFADRVDYLDRASWDQLVAPGGSVFLRRDVLRVFEQHGPQNIVPRYAMIFRDSKPVAILAAQIVTVTGAELQAEKPERASGLLRRALAPAAKVARANIRERILVAGNLFS